MRGVRTHAHENRELDWARWVRRAAADICAAAERAHLGPSSQPIFEAVTTVRHVTVVKETSVAVEGQWWLSPMVFRKKFLPAISGDLQWRGWKRAMTL